jgi:hypothetical protein
LALLDFLPEQRSHTPLRAIPIDGAPDPFRCDDAKTVSPQGVRPAEQREVPP